MSKATSTIHAENKKAEEVVRAVEHFLRHCQTTPELAYYMMQTESLSRMVESVAVYRGYNRGYHSLGCSPREMGYGLTVKNPCTESKHLPSERESPEARFSGCTTKPWGMQP